MAGDLLRDMNPNKIQARNNRVNNAFSNNFFENVILYKTHRLKKKNSELVLAELSPGKVIGPDGMSLSK
jgi:hypothetical protein